MDEAVGDHDELVAARKRIAELAIHRKAEELFGDVSKGRHEAVTVMAAAAIP
jgi:hypothetical protein